jgi:hypothetical protein
VYQLIRLDFIRASYTIVDFFWYTYRATLVLKFSKNRSQQLKPKKVESFLTWSTLPKFQWHVVTLHYKPCDDDTPTAAAVALTTGGVSLLICKNILFSFHTFPSDTQLQWRQLDDRQDSTLFRP